MPAPESTDAAAEASAPTAAAALHPCVRCGQPVVEDEGGICGPCEIEVEAAISAEAGTKS